MSETRAARFDRTVCPTCGGERSSWKVGETAEDWQAAHNARFHYTPQPGDGVTEHLWSDTVAYRVVEVQNDGRRMILSLLDPTDEQRKAWTENIDGNPYPTLRHTWTAEEIAAHPAEGYTTATLRKNGKWHLIGSPMRGGNPGLTFGAVTVTDYRY